MRTGGACAASEPDRAPLQPRLEEDLRVLLRHRPELVITSVGSPAPVLAALHHAGALVFADVASIRHAQRAVEAGADGLVLLTAGAGGQTGWLNPFVFVRAVRAFFDGPVVLAGGIGDGHALRAAEALGCDLAYMGTKFIATHESMADARYKQMLVDSSADDIFLTAPSRGCRPTCCGPRSRPPALIPTTCRSAAASTSARTSTSARAMPPAAGATSGAPGIPPRASPGSALCRT